MVPSSASAYLVGIVLASVFWPGLAYSRLIAYWDFDNGDMSDRCGIHDGALAGDLELVTGHREKGTALGYSGNGWVSVKHHPDFDITHELTCSAWIKVDRFDKVRQAIITKGESAWMLQRGKGTNTVALTLRGVTSDNKDGNTPRGVKGEIDVADGKWHHVVGVYDGTRAAIYVDGVLDKAVPARGTIWTKDCDIYIGANFERSERTFRGSIDEVSIFNHALEAKQVQLLYEQGTASFIPEGYMRRLVTSVRDDIRTRSAEEAVSAIQRQIAQYEHWRRSHPHSMHREDQELSPEVYYLLAQRKERAGFSKPEVCQAYRQVISRTSTRSQDVPLALLWLYRNLPADESKCLFHGFVDNPDYLSYRLHQAVEYFATQDAWNAFVSLCSTVFSDDNLDPGLRHMLYQVVLRAMKVNSSWTMRFQEFSHQQPYLTDCVFHADEMEAQELLGQEDYIAAAESYERIAKRCQPNQNKGLYQFKMCECLWRGGRYEDALRQLDNFIETHRENDWSLVCQAIILKGQCYVNLGAVDEATDTFLDLVIRYPDAKQVVQAIFFVGSYSMLQGDYERAKTAFNLLMQKHPDNAYANKSKTFLKRIAEVTE